MVTEALELGFEVLVLTNAMAPMQRPGVKAWLAKLHNRFPGKLTLRVSLDHYTAALHDEERGAGSFAKALEGTDWLASNGFQIAVAGRMCWGENHDAAIAGYAALFAERGWHLNATSTRDLVLFPEMDAAADVPEITPGCWSILNVSPDAMMCASSRMVVKRRGRRSPRGSAVHAAPLRCALRNGGHTRRCRARGRRRVRPRRCQARSPALLTLLRAWRRQLLMKKAPKRHRSGADHHQCFMQLRLSYVFATSASRISFR